MKPTPAPAPSPAHPRSRGENDALLDRRRRRGGSSPLTRGKRPRHPRPLPELRLIPAHAGKTTWGRCCTSPPRAHPRSRGENDSQRAALDGPRGSSPLTRGKHDQLRPSRGPRGLIPAHAGKTAPPVSSSSGAGAHPRSRGENEIGGGLGAHLLGSSPLTRGKHFLTCAFIA